MEKKRLLKVVIFVSLAVMLAVGLPLVGGCRPALVAREGDISRQFLTEAAFLSFGGGIIGVVVGVGVSNIISGIGLLGA